MPDHVDVMADHVDVMVDHVDVIPDLVDVMVDHVDVMVDHVDVMADHVDVMRDHVDVMGDHADVTPDHVDATPDRARSTQDHVRSMYDHVDPIPHHVRHVGGRGRPCSGCPGLPPEGIFELDLKLFKAFVVDLLSGATREMGTEQEDWLAAARSTPPLPAVVAPSSPSTDAPKHVIIADSTTTSCYSDSFPCY